jgi:hypothetical protein
MRVVIDARGLDADEDRIRRFGSYDVALPGTEVVSGFCHWLYPVREVLSGGSLIGFRGAEWGGATAAWYV